MPTFIAKHSILNAVGIVGVPNAKDKKSRTKHTLSAIVLIGNSFMINVLKNILPEGRCCSIFNFCYCFF